jgi:hypothetical protein
MDRHRPLALSIPLEFMKPNTFQRAQLTETCRRIKGAEQFKRRVGIKAGKPRLTVIEKAARGAVSPRLDHASSLVRRP